MNISTVKSNANEVVDITNEPSGRKFTDFTTRSRVEGS